MRLPSVLRDRPLLFWAAVFLGLPAVLLILPLDWSKTGTPGLLRQKPPLHTTSERVAEIDRALAQGKTVRLSAARLQTIKPMLQARRLLAAGPMDAGELRRAVKMCREMNLQIQREEQASSRRAVRTMWHERLAAALPRLRGPKIPPALQTLRRQLDDQVVLRPAASSDDS